MKEQKRNKHITVNLTQEESDTIQALADIYDRKPADIARILLNRAAFAEWVKVQAEQHPSELVKIS